MTSKTNQAIRAIQLMGLFLLSQSMLMPSSLQGQASLAAEDIIDEVPVTIDGEETAFTVLRDAFNEQQWYYVPDLPRVYERRSASGDTEPEFALIRYQFADPDNPEDLAEGGFLQFAMSLALPDEALPQLKAAIAQREGIPATAVRLSALPFDSAEVSLYVPQSGELITSELQGPGIAPTFSTQKVVFSIALSRIGSDVLDELVTGNTGLGAAVIFTYNGLTPPAGFEIYVDWDQAYSHYSKDQKFRAKAGFMGWFGAEAKADKTEVLDELVSNKVIDWSVTEGPQISQAELEKYLTPILNRINTELLANMKPPTEVPPASADSVDGSGGKFAKTIKNFLGFGGGAGYSVAIRKQELVKKGTETITFKVRSHQKRKTVAAGFVGIGRYPEEMQQKLVTIVPPGPWRSAYFFLPNVGDASSIGIRQVDLQVRLRADGQAQASQAVTWQPEGGWRGRGGDDRSLLAFGLMSHRDEDLSFEQTAQITVKNDVLTVTDTLSVDDERAISTPLALAKVVHVVADDLSFSRLDEESELVSVTVGLRSGDRSFSALIKPARIGAEWVPPATASWLVERGSGPVVADIHFRLADGSRIAWTQNGINLVEGQEASSDLYIELLDSDWQQ